MNHKLAFTKNFTLFNNTNKNKARIGLWLVFLKGLIMQEILKSVIY